MDSGIPLLGEILAVSTAIIWALAVMLFKKGGETIHPIALNAYKNILAAVLLLITMMIIGESLYKPIPVNDYILLSLSGILGIGISDTLYFKCLNMLGAGRTAIVACLYSPSFIFLSMVILGERLSALQFIGAILIISAVLVSTHKKSRETISVSTMIAGLMYGLVAMLCMAIGIIIIKPLLNELPLLWTAEVRLIAGIIVLAIVMAFRSDRRKLLRSALIPEKWRYAFFGSFLGSYINMVIWLGGMKYTKVSIAAALSQTSSIFVFLFAAWFLKEKITPIKGAAITVAVAGAVMIIIYR
jgi:drug/metabolite transporter (DMT)-like permease